MSSAHYSVKKVVTGNGLFTITARCPKQIEAGGTIRLSIFFKHQRDGPVNPSGLTCKVYEGQQMATLKATLTTYQDIYGTGSYFADWNCPNTQGSGGLYCQWNGTYQSEGTSTAEPVQATQVFRVVNPTGKVY
ncbi:MAG: hypothetical protein ACYCPP_05670 [Nitrososphaerales archaeon]